MPKKNSISYRLKLIRRAKEGDSRAFQEYRDLNKGLMAKLVAQYRGWLQDDEVDDLRQEANLGLLKGIQAYKLDKRTTKQAPPEGYIFAWVRAYVSRYTNVHGTFSQSKFVSIDAEQAGGEEDGPALQLEGTEPGCEEAFYGTEINAWKKSVMKKLLPREREIAKVRTFCEDPQTLEEVGDELGVSRERIRQMELQVKRKLQRLYTEDFGPK